MTDPTYFDITRPLILSTGGHAPGSGRGCAMEVLSWTIGESFTDSPYECDIWLAWMVQCLNDALGEKYGTFIDGEHELQPEHALICMDLAFRTRGTNVTERNEIIEKVSSDLCAKFSHLRNAGYGYVYVAFDCGVQGNPNEAIRYTEFAIDRFRFYAGLDIPTIPDSGAVDRALAAIASRSTIAPLAAQNS